MARDPYCGNCGYSLKGLTESSRCPECGRPLVEVLERGAPFSRGRRYTSDIVLFGLPLVSIALGPHEEEKYGRARGIIAIGDVATGWVAWGGHARGIIAFGGSAIGFIAAGGMAAGVFAFGGWAVGLVALGGGALGGVAVGGGAVGYIAEGGAAYGYYAAGGAIGGAHLLGPNRTDAEAARVFGRLHATLGIPGRVDLRYFVSLSASVVGLVLVTAVLLAVVLSVTYALQRRGGRTARR